MHIKYIEEQKKECFLDRSSYHTCSGRETCEAMNLFGVSRSASFLDYVHSYSLRGRHANSYARQSRMVRMSQSRTTPHHIGNKYY